MKVVWNFVATFLITNLWLPVAPADDVDPRKPAAIQTQEVPVIPAEIFARLSQYQSVRAAAFRGWAPTGRGMLIATRFGNSAQLHRVYEPSGRREQITFFDEPVSGEFIPGVQDEALLLSIDHGGNEQNQVFLFDQNKYETELLTDGKSRNYVGPILRDGSKMIVTSNRRNGTDTDLYLADPRKPDSLQMLFQTNRQSWSATDWSPDGKWLLLSRYVSINESYPALLNLATGERTDLPLPSNEPTGLGSLAFNYDGKSVYMTLDSAGEFRRLARFDLVTKEYEWLTSDIPWDVTELEIEPKSGDLAFTVNEDGASKLYLLPGRDATKRRALPLPLGIVSTLRFTPDGKQLGFTLSRPDLPADVYSLRLSNGELTRWTYSEVGGLNPATFVTPSRVQFKSFDGRMIPAYCYRPKVTGPDRKVPVIINIHGGPESQFRPYFSGLTQYFVHELGAAVIYPNVRGSSGYGKTYLKLDNAELREDSVKDIGALLDWISTQPDLDASRVAVTGGSYGGYMVLASLVHFPDRIKAGVDSVGIANFLTFLAKTAAYRVDLRRVEYGDERDPKIRAFFERISPLNQAEKIRSALMVVHGRNDPRVPFHEAEQIVAKVRGNGRTVWTVYADNEGHGFSKKDNSDYLRAAEVLFLRKHLLE